MPYPALTCLPLRLRPVFWCLALLRAARPATRLGCGLAGVALAVAAVATLAAPLPAQAQSETSAALSLLPVASVVGAGSAGSTAAGTVLALPAALSVGGALLSVVAVQASAHGTVYLLERASDGARASVEVLGRGAGVSAQGVGTVVVCSAIGTGVLLSVAGEVLAFVPNAIGQALLHHERL